MTLTARPSPALRLRAVLEFAIFSTAAPSPCPAGKPTTSDDLRADHNPAGGSTIGDL